MLLQTIFNILHRFLLKYMKASEKKGWAHLATLRLSEGTNCFGVSMCDLCASPITHTMQPLSCAFRRGTRESPTLARRILARLCVVALWAVARACLLEKHWNGACCSDNAARHIFIETLQSKVLLRKPTLSGGVTNFSFLGCNAKYRSKKHHTFCWSGLQKSKIRWIMGNNPFK